MMTTNTKYIALTDKNFETQVLESKQPVLVDFWRPGADRATPWLP